MTDTAHFPDTSAPIDEAEFSRRFSSYVSSLAPNAARILYDVSQAIFEHLDDVESAVAANDFEIGAKISVAVQWKPGTESEPAAVHTSATASIPSVKRTRRVVTDAGQLTLI